MDCCPVVVSDLPALCSRVDGTVTGVKTEPLNSMRPYPDWGKFLLIHSCLPCPNVSSLSFQREQMTFIGELQVPKAWNLQYDSAWRVINSVWYGHFHFPEESALFYEWGSQILQQQKTYSVFSHRSSPMILHKEKEYSFICEYFKLCNLFFITISNNSVRAISLTEPGQILSNAHFDEPYFSLSSTILFYEVSKISPVLSIMYNVDFLSGNDLIPPWISCRECPWGKLTTAFVQEQSRAFVFNMWQKSECLCSAMKVKRVGLLSHKNVFWGGSWGN